VLGGGIACDRDGTWFKSPPMSIASSSNKGSGPLRAKENPALCVGGLADCITGV